MAEKVLFMGDSITDAGRSYDGDYHMGYGYATLVAAALGADRPNAFVFQNRGIGGNRSIDLLGRIKKDMLNLKPDYMSILIGINDVWHDYDGLNNGIDAQLFESYYEMLLNQLKQALPDLKIMLMEPFVTHGTAVDWMWETFRKEVENRAEITRRIAEKYNLPFVRLMSVFDNACQAAPAEHWTHDGVHPTAAGHELIKRCWLESFPG